VFFGASVHISGETRVEWLKESGGYTVYTLKFSPGWEFHVLINDLVYSRRFIHWHKILVQKIITRTRNGHLNSEGIYKLHVLGVNKWILDVEKKGCSSCWSSSLTIIHGK
jgi:hypothetical protein